MNFGMPKQVCADCHFFCRHYRSHNGQDFTFEIQRKSRDLAVAGDFSWQRPTEAIACHKGIWDEGAGLRESSKAQQVSETDRRGRCYYFKYQPGVLFPAAEKLQQEASSRSSEKLKLRLTIYALILTIAGMLVKLVLERA